MAHILSIFICIFLCLKPAFAVIWGDPGEGHLHRSFRREKIDTLYETVLTPDDSRELAAIQRVLHLTEFPVLPLSYRFEQITRAEEEVPVWCIRKYREAPTVSLGLYVFGAPRRGGLAYVVHHDGNLMYSYAPTREPTYEGERTPFSFTARGIAYVDGHTIDHADTPEEEFHFYPGCLSTNHRAAHLPEPPNSYWGLHIRRPLVGEIRDLRGSYSQFSCYADIPERTDDRITIPFGVLFFEHHPDGRMVNGWNIPWRDPIHSQAPDGVGPRNRLRSYQLPVASHQGPRGHRHLQTLAYTYPEVHETMAPQEDVTLLLENPLNPLTRYRLEILADSEDEAHYSSMLYLNGLLTLRIEEGRSYEQTHYWGRRALQYIRGLEAYDVRHFIGNPGVARRVLENLRTHPFFDRDHIEYDSWLQMLNTQQDSGTRFLSHINAFEEEAGGGPGSPELIRGAIADEPPTPPTPFLITLPTGKGSASQTIRPAASEFRTPREIVLSASGGSGHDTRKVLLFLRKNKDFLREHREKIPSIRISEPSRLNDHEDVKKCLEDIFRDGA